MMNVKLSFTRSLSISLLTLIAIVPSVISVNDIDDIAILRNQVHRHPRALNLHVPSCNPNQYFDKEDGQCLGVTGGGRMVHVNYTKSCGTNVLRPHCTNSQYYFICKQKKTILAQCADGQHFENRLQRCALTDRKKLTSSTDQLAQEVYDHVHPPICKEPGRFPVPGHCAIFYTCETNGHRMFQNIFRCPEKTGYDPEKEICSSLANCEVDKSICVPSIDSEELRMINEFNMDEQESVGTETSDSSTLNPNSDETKALDEGEDSNPMIHKLELIKHLEVSTTITSDYKSTTTEEVNTDESSTSDTPYPEDTSLKFTGIPDNSDITVSSEEHVSEMSRSLNTMDYNTPLPYSLAHIDDAYTTTSEVSDLYYETEPTESSFPEGYDTTTTTKPITGTTQDVTSPEDISSIKELAYDGMTESSETEMTSATNISPIDSPVSTPEAENFNLESETGYDKSSEHVTYDTSSPLNQLYTYTTVASTPELEETTVPSLSIMESTYSTETDPEYFPESDAITLNDLVKSTTVLPTSTYELSTVEETEGINSTPAQSLSEVTTESLEASYSESTTDGFTVSNNPNAADYSTTDIPVDRAPALLTDDETSNETKDIITDSATVSTITSTTESMYLKYSESASNEYTDSHDSTLNYDPAVITTPEVFTENETDVAPPTVTEAEPNYSEAPNRVTDSSNYSNVDSVLNSSEKSASKDEPSSDATEMKNSKTTSSVVSSTESVDQVHSGNTFNEKPGLQGKDKAQDSKPRSTNSKQEPFIDEEYSEKIKKIVSYSASTLYPILDILSRLVPLNLAYLSNPEHLNELRNSNYTNAAHYSKREIKMSQSESLLPEGGSLNKTDDAATKSLLSNLKSGRKLRDTVVRLRNTGEATSFMDDKFPSAKNGERDAEPVVEESFSSSEYYNVGAKDEEYERKTVVREAILEKVADNSNDNGKSDLRKLQITPYLRKSFDFNLRALELAREFVKKLDSAVTNTNNEQLSSLITNNQLEATSEKNNDNGKNFVTSLRKINSRSVHVDWPSEAEVINIANKLEKRVKEIVDRIAT